MATGQPRAAQILCQGKGPSSLSNEEEEDDSDRCSYEEQRNERVEKMRQMMLPMERASKNW